jgi:hypothetical protein
MDAPAEIGRDHRPVGHDGARIAVGDDPPGIHADQPFGDLEQNVDDMLDPDNGEATRLELTNGGDKFARLAVGKAAADLVEQQNRWTGAERARQFEPLAVEQAKRFGAPIGDAHHAAKRDRFDRPYMRCLAVQLPALRRRHEYILEHCHTAERLRDLMSAHDAEPAAFGGA